MPLAAGTRVRGISEATAFLTSHFAGLTTERFVALGLRRSRIRLSHERNGSRLDVELDLDHLFLALLRGRCDTLILAHNHPSGRCKPSPSDLRATRTIKTVCDTLGIKLSDHLIFARDGVTSFRALDLL